MIIEAILIGKARTEFASNGGELTDAQLRIAFTEEEIVALNYHEYIELDQARDVWKFKELS